MSGCRNNKIKCNCGTHQNARCVYYDAYLPKYSKLDEDCVNIDETTGELYENQEKILDSIDLVKLGKKCIDYSEFQEEGSLKVKEAFLTLENEICELKNKKNGERRIVISYFSIGEAEDYRSYWKNDWNKKLPSWIVEENPNWKGNYIVKYWNNEWKSIVNEYQKNLDDINFEVKG